MSDEQNPTNPNILLSKFNSVFKVTDCIFKDRSVLTDAYIPDSIVGRDAQILEIASNLQPIIDVVPTSPNNMFLTGENGSGKTSSMRYVIKVIETGIAAMGRDISIDFININCAVRNNDLEVCKELTTYFKLGINPEGFSIISTMQRVWDCINERAKQTESYTVLFFFDEVDKLNAKKKLPNTEVAQLDLLYQLTRARECGLLTESNCKVGIITASNKPHFLETVERSITTSAGFYTLTFPNYKEDDLFLILMDRIHAFQPGAVTKNIIRYVAKDVAERYRGDARRALDTLKYAGKFALDDNSSSITLQHVQEAEEKINLLANEKLVAGYSKHDIYLFLAIDLANQYTLKIGGEARPNTGIIYAIYDWLCSLLGQKSTTLENNSRILKQLADNGILMCERGKIRGNTRLYTLTGGMQKALKAKYTPEFQSLITKNEIDLELLVGEKLNPKKSKNKQLNGF